MAIVQLIATSLLLATAVATDIHDKSASLRNKALAAGAGNSHRTIVKQPDIDQHLLVCNAYASPSALDIYHVQSLERLTRSAPLKYKECREFITSLAEGDQLDFKAGNLDVGTFYASGLPTASASLLLVPHRRDSNTVAISFESHAFADLQSPQIAVVDAYKGKGQSGVKIMDVLPEGSTLEAIEETLKFASVVAVNPGRYKVALTEAATGSNSSAGLPLNVQKQAKYVVMRVGVDSTTAKGARPYPQELIVFPSSCLGLTLGIGTLALCALATAFANLI